MTVLLVDDHPLVRQGLRTLLESYSDVAVVGEAWDGREAVQLTDQLRPSVVVMDINMPKLNGIEATAQIKRRHPDITVIGLSINAEVEHQNAMQKAGASTLVPKETVVQRLYGSIRHALTAHV